ncbi:MAG: efflux RND transporter periplasmic adaptor subunit [Halioglobus sp.]
MASKKRQIFLSVIMLLVSVGITTLLYMNRPPTEVREPVYLPVTVDVAEVVKESLRVPVQAQGSVTPLRETALLAEVGGRVIEVSDAFNAGGFVSAGDVLLKIDPSDYEAGLLRARSAVASASSGLAQEKGRAEVAAREWSKLPKGSQRSQDAKDLYLRKPQLAQAEAQLLSAKADLESAQDDLDRTIIRAPYDALIKAKRAELGKFVSPGTPLADIFSIEAAEIRLPIPQNRLPYLELPQIGEAATGSSIDLYTDVGGVVNHWPAYLHRTEGVYDERSRVLYTVARIDDPYGLKTEGREPLRMGTFVNANIEGKQINDVVRLPRYLLKAGNFVWVIDEAMHLRNRAVELLKVGGDQIYISAGLDEGDLVSLTSLDNSFDGSEVRIKSSTPTDRLDASGRPLQEEKNSPKETMDETTAAVDPKAATMGTDG